MTEATPIIQPHEVLFENATYAEFVEVIEPLLERGRAAVEGDAPSGAWREYHKVVAILSLVNSVRDSTEFPSAQERPGALRVSTGEMFIEYQDARLPWQRAADTNAVVDVTGYPDIERMRFTHVPESDW